MLYQCGPPTARICIVISKNNKVGSPYPSSVYIPPQYKQHSYPACRGLPWLVSTMDCQAAPTLDCQAASTRDCQATLIVHYHFIIIILHKFKSLVNPELFLQNIDEILQ